MNYTIYYTLLGNANLPRFPLSAIYTNVTPLTLLCGFEIKLHIVWDNPPQLPSVSTFISAKREKK